jgi:predicted ATPase
MPSDIPQRKLLGRRSESTTLDQLLEAVRAGESRALVIRGDPGMGKTALLD